MPEITSAAYKTAIHSNARELHCKATIQTADATVYNLTTADIVARSMAIDSFCLEEGFELGTCFAETLQISLRNDEGQWNGIDLDGATIWVYSGVKLADTTIEYVLLGTFIIDEPGRPYNTLAIGAVDRLVLLDKSFAGVSITYPATNYQILQAISTHCNIPLAASIPGALNMDYSVTSAPVGDFSCRDIVQQICVMAAGFGRMSRLGAFEIIQFPGLSGPTYDISLSTNERFRFQQLTDLVTLTGLSYRDLTETVQLGTEVYSLQLEYLNLLQSNRDDTLAEIWAEISGYSYTGFESVYIGDPSINIGDSIWQLTAEGEEIVSVVTKHVFAHGGDCTLSAAAKSTVSIDYVAQNTKRLAAITQKQADMEVSLSTYQQASAQMRDLMTVGFGLYSTEEVQEDGSVIEYMHDEPLLADSTLIWMQTALTWTYSADGGETWNGYDVNGNILANILNVIGINAEWINAETLSAISASLGTVTAGLLRSTDSKFEIDLANKSIKLEGVVNSKGVKIEISPSNPFKLSMVGVTNYQNHVYVTDSTGWSGSNILVTSKFDVNEDGIVDDEDLEIVTKYVLHQSYTPGVAWPGGFPAFARMDVNDDGIVSSSDLTQISLHAVTRDHLATGAHQLGIDASWMWWSDDWGVTKTFVGAPTNWTPADASGAGLTFSFARQAKYSKIGKVVHMFFDVTWPTNTNGSYAMVGLPFTADGAFCGDIGFNNYGAVLTYDGGNFYNLAGTPLTNAQLSGKRMSVSATYRSTT